MVLQTLIYEDIFLTLVLLNVIYFIGDSGYALEERLLPPFQRETERCQQNFNRKHKKTRSTVERAIGTWKSRFRSIDKYVFIVENILAL